MFLEDENVPLVLGGLSSTVYVEKEKPSSKN
jgi:hypothetical protein